MKKEFEKVDERAREAAGRFGSVAYNVKGMFAPPDGAAGPFATHDSYVEAFALAERKLSYLLDSRDPLKTSDPHSFLDLRDGGTDRCGEPGKPVMTGWLDYAARALADTTFLRSLERAAGKIRADFKAFVVIGIGGSYTDVAGVIDALHPLPQGGADAPFPIYYLGQHLSADEYDSFFRKMEALEGKAAVNIISKSGTTLEPALASRLVLERLQSLGKLGAVFATTDPARGALRETALAEGYNPTDYVPEDMAREFYIGEDIGGRFSCITPVGLFPYAVAGVAVEEFLLGYHYAVTDCRSAAAEQAAVRFAANQAGATQLVLSYNLACLRGKILAFRQLWPESTGKDGKGLNVMDEFYTSDAHSNVQLIASGPRNMMEVFFFVDSPPADFTIPAAGSGRDGLNDVAGCLSLHTVNNLFMSALLIDHRRRGVPVTAVRLPRLAAFHLGMLSGIEHLAAAVYGLMSGTNPVNQPGVQGYKEIAHCLLGLKGKERRDKAMEELRAFGL